MVACLVVTYDVKSSERSNGTPAVDVDATATDGFFEFFLLISRLCPGPHSLVVVIEGIDISSPLKV